LLEDEDDGDSEEELPELNQVWNHIRRRMIEEEEEEEEEEVMSEEDEAELEGGNEIEQGWPDVLRFF
jgi:hypothetical protein